MERLHRRNSGIGAAGDFTAPTAGMGMVQNRHEADDIYTICVRERRYYKPDGARPYRSDGELGVYIKLGDGNAGSVCDFIQPPSSDANQPTDMDLTMEKIKAWFIAILIGFFNPYPMTIAAAVAVLAVVANLLGMLAAVRKGEPVSGNKILRGNIRIAVYFVIFSAIYHAIKGFVFGMHLLSAIYSAIALYEFGLCLQKGVEVGIIPRGILKSFRNAVDKHTNSGANPSGVQ